eukprot:UN09139
MAGNYNRYMAEVYNTSVYKEKANEYYCDAVKIGTEILPSTHPTLMGLSLNYAVFLYDIAYQP